MSSPKTFMALVTEWRDSANKSQAHLSDYGMEIENETHMRDMRVCAEQLEALILVWSYELTKMEQMGDISEAAFRGILGTAEGKP